MNKLYIIALIAFFSACSNSKQSTLIEDYSLDKDSLMMQIVPFIAKLHDSISNQGRFLDKNRSYMESHIIERQYQWLNFYTDKDSWSYFQVSRLEPSLKNDKFSAICGRFKLNAKNTIDSSSFDIISQTISIISVPSFVSFVMSLPLSSIYAFAIYLYPLKPFFLSFSYIIIF